MTWTVSKFDSITELYDWCARHITQPHTLYVRGNSLAYLHCPRCNDMFSLNTTGDPPRHTFTVENDVPTIDPSIGHASCGAHFFIKNGIITWTEDYVP